MRLLRLFLIAVTALLLLPFTASPALAATANLTVVAQDSNGKPLEFIHWEIYTKSGSNWTTYQFGPKLTNSAGKFSWNVPVGGEYRVCLFDDYYDENPANTSGFWAPEVRQRDTCWPNATSLQTAQSWSPSSAASKALTITMPKQGLGMAPVEPFVEGSYQVGQPLTIRGQEGWRPTNATFSYQWISQADGADAAPIAGATGATFTPTAAQSGTWVWARVAASLPGYKTALMSTPVTKVGTTHIQPTSPLKISGTAKPGSKLTASFGYPANAYAELTWFVDGVPRREAKSYDSATSTYTVTAADSGARIDARLKLYKTDAAGNYVDGSDYFDRVQVQVSGTRPVQPLATPVSAAGQPAVGRVLTAPANVTADPNAKVSYQWLRGATPVKGATATRYKLRKADLGKAVQVRISVSRPGWWSSYVGTSSATVVKKALKSGRVKLVGKARTGKKLTVRATGWGPKPVKLRYQWLRDGQAIKGATKARYKVRKADKRAKLQVRVTVKKKRYLTVTKTSKAVKVKR